MVKAEVLFTEGEYERLKKKSQETGKTLSEVVREAVAGFLESRSQPRRDRALALIGAFEAERSDISVRHDEFLPGHSADHSPETGA